MVRLDGRSEIADSRGSLRSRGCVGALGCATSAPATFERLHGQPLADRFPGALATGETGEISV